MNDWDTIQSAPEKFGVEIVAEYETGGSYEFCTTLVVREVATGHLYAAHDSGCSCPTPFEDLKSLSDWVLVSDADDLTPLLDEHYDNRPADMLAFVNTVRAVLR